MQVLYSAKMPITQLQQQKSNNNKKDASNGKIHKYCLIPMWKDNDYKRN